MCPHRFGHTWSSRKIPDAPAASHSSTVRAVLTGLPYPVSPSTTTHSSGAAAHTRRATSAISVWVSSPTSGCPSSVPATA